MDIRRVLHIVEEDGERIVSPSPFPFPYGALFTQRRWRMEGERHPSTLLVWFRDFTKRMGGEGGERKSPLLRQTEGGREERRGDE